MLAVTFWDIEQNCMGRQWTEKMGGLFSVMDRGCGPNKRKKNENRMEFWWQPQKHVTGNISS